VAVLRTYADEQYRADHGLLVIRDKRLADPDPATPELLTENAVEAQPGGTIAVAGAGWLWARTSSADDHHHVLLEAHDGVPPDDRSGWDDVTETPYLSDGGTVELGWLLGEGGEGSLPLGPPGLYRARASCRRERDDEGDTWRLQFWPVHAVPEPPRWLARGEPAAGDQGSGWEEVLDYDVSTLRGAEAPAQHRRRC
jgi:hypothetical protein